MELPSSGMWREPRKLGLLYEIKRIRDHSTDATALLLQNVE